MAVTLNANTSTGFIATSDTSGVLQLQTGGTTAVNVDASQNVGIGTNNPGHRLDVQAAQTTINATSTTGTNPVYLRLNNTGGYFFAGRDGSTGSSFGTPYASIVWSNGAYPMVFGTNDTERMRIDSSGNVGIGTTSPNTKLQVYKAATSAFTGTSPGALLVTDSTNTLNYFTSIDFNTTNAPSVPYARIGMSYTSGGSTLSFGTTNSYASGITNTAMTIDPSGNLGIGISGPAAVLDVVQPSASANGGRVAYFRSTASGDVANSAVIISKFDNNTTTSQIFLKFEVNNTSTSCGRITANGANTAAFGSTSDRRVKENIVDLPPQLANIMALRPVEFDYVESYGGGHQIGFIAQDMEQIYSDVVSEDDTEQKIKSITGWSKTEARLVKAIQEQQAIITTLTDRITALEGTTP